MFSLEHGIVQWFRNFYVHKNNFEHIITMQFPRPHSSFLNQVLRMVPKDVLTQMTSYTAYGKHSKSTI